MGDEPQVTDRTSLPAERAALKLAALDAEDLAVFSAHLQDATVRVGDMAYLQKARRFALLASRFDWALYRTGPCERVSAGLHFERVFRVRRHGFDQDPGRVLTLLAIVFVVEEAPSGTVVLTFAEGGAIRLDVECLEAALQDVGPRWTVDCRPEAALPEAPYA